MDWSAVPPTRCGLVRRRSTWRILLLYTSALHAFGIGRHVVKGEGHRHAGVVTHQTNNVGDADVAERLDGAIVEALRDPARIREANRHLVDDLLPLVVERRGQTR